MLDNIRLGIKIIREDGLLTFLGILKSRYRLPIPMSHQQQWQAGIKSELRFWDDYFHAPEWQADLHNRLDPELPLQAKFLPLLPAYDEVRILDVGAGPLTSIGKKCPGKQLLISAIDPLAMGYTRLLDKYHLQPLIPTEKGEAENLTGAFAANSFDLVIAQNSLDHSYNPVAAIQEMLAVTRPGGYLYLEHFFNVAESLQYSGMHQWNFSLSAQGDFLIQSKNSQTNISQKYATECHISCETKMGISKEWLVVKIQKL